MNGGWAPVLSEKIPAAKGTVRGKGKVGQAGAQCGGLCAGLLTPHRHSTAGATTVQGPNTAPEIPAIGNQTMATGQVLTIALPTADADGDTISYEVEVVENIAANAHDTYSVYADTGLVNADYGYNYLGQQERWVQSSSGWMFITTEGTLHLWSGAYTSSPEVARLDTRHHADPSLLVNAQHIDVSVTVSGGQLQISISDGYVGELNIRLNASDGMETVEETFPREVTAVAWAGLVDDVFEEDKDWN